ncbi:HNH endonuclease [Tokyovirus A1]|uniref:HNH endonuclease n=1 Tax=Tokyovirus A1 TaxID=1826170 RepID=UPI0007A95F62|nr:HNH endonuclease [Tokyovirus A1]BAU80299.1 HNH homing endonuclease [Tokyovirus A1]
MCDCGEEEIWKPIEGYEYQVSSCGRIKNENGQLVPCKTVRGASHVRLPKKEVRVARIVAAAFLPNPEGMKCVNRHDEDCENNHVSNLFWAPRGIRKSTKFLRLKPVEQWTKDGSFVRLWESPQEIARVFSSKVQQVRDCCNGKFKTFAGFVWKWGDDPDLEGEVWKNYSGKNRNILKVSNKGRLLLNGNIKTFGKKNTRGYMKYSNLFVHRLVAEAFCGELRDDLVVNHRNSQPSDNRVENLEICTHSWNTRHSFLSEKEKESMVVVDLEGEIWKDIPNMENFKVSSRGRVSSPENFLLRQRENYGNVVVTIKGKIISVKKLVADAFIGERTTENVIHCIDGNPYNLQVENLQICRRGEEIGRKKTELSTDIIVQMNEMGEILREFATKEEAISSTQGVSFSGLGRALSSGKKYMGFLWCYKSSFDLDGEEWRTILYRNKTVTVSSFGRVLEKARKKTCGSLCDNGHVYHKTMKVHRLVAKAFLEEPKKEQKTVMHINGRKDDNRVSNLSWATMTTIAQNINGRTTREEYRNDRHAHKTGLISLPDRS